MDYKKSRRIFRNNFPDEIKKTNRIVGNFSFGRFTMPTFWSCHFRKRTKAEELADAERVEAEKKAKEAAKKKPTRSIKKQTKKDEN